MKRLKIGLTGVAALGAVLVVAAPAIGGSNVRPRPIQLQTASQSVRAAQGSYCVSYTDPRPPHEGTGVCADYAYPTTHGRLRLKEGQRFSLCTHDRAIHSIRMQLVEYHGDQPKDVGRVFQARPREGHPARWIAKLPAGSASANRVDIFVRYEHEIGDSSASAGLRVR